ncbi:MAG: hypothetical protein LBB61_05760 [Treponema sp.]|jgi:hypothetical protein|nr:hypothetical protein [Treponema sp.]
MNKNLISWAMLVSLSALDLVLAGCDNLYGGGCRYYRANSARFSLDKELGVFYEKTGWFRIFLGFGIVHRFCNDWV